MPYRSPQLPTLPSSSINDFLQSRFSSAPDNILKAVISHFVCAIYQSIMMTYFALRRGSTVESYRLWIVSNLLVSSVITLASVVIYKVVMASSFVVRAMLFYGLVFVAALTVVMAIVAVVFYDRQMKAGDASKEAALTADEMLGYEDYRKKSSSSAATEDSTHLTKTE